MVALENYINLVNIKGEFIDVVNWLVENIEDCERQTVKEYLGRPKPYDFSAISQYARFKGNTELWYLEIRGNEQRKEVWIKNTVDPKIITQFALQWGKFGPWKK